MQTDRSNRFAFVPHIARLNDNVLEPPRNNPGPNSIYQYRFDESTGRLSPNDPLELKMTDNLGPRHYTFHPYAEHRLFFRRAGLQRDRLSIGRASPGPCRPSRRLAVFLMASPCGTPAPRYK